MPIPEDRQQNMIEDTRKRITQTRQQVQRHAHGLIQAQATLAALPSQTQQYREEAVGTYHEDEWDGLVQAFGGLKAPVDAAVATDEIQALDALEV